MTWPMPAGMPVTPLSTSPAPAATPWGAIARCAWYAIRDDAGDPWHDFAPAPGDVLLVDADDRALAAAGEDRWMVVPRADGSLVATNERSAAPASIGVVVVLVRLLRDPLGPPEPVRDPQAAAAATVERLIEAAGERWREWQECHAGAERGERCDALYDAVDEAIAELEGDRPALMALLHDERLWQLPQEPQGECRIFDDGEADLAETLRNAIGVYVGIRLESMGAP